MNLFNGNGKQDNSNIMGSEYFDFTRAYIDERDLKEDVDATEKSKKYFTWVQEFSKKIVTITFILYVTTSLANLVLVYLSFKIGSISGIDTLISETNQTFREVIGGYIIKSAVENSFKIIGNYFFGVTNSRLSYFKSRDELKCNMEDNGIKEDNISDMEDMEFSEERAAG